MEDDYKGTLNNSTFLTKTNVLVTPAFIEFNIFLYYINMKHVRTMFENQGIALKFLEGLKNKNNNSKINSRIQARRRGGVERQIDLSMCSTYYLGSQMIKKMCC